MKKNNVAVVVLVYNGMQYLPELFSSLRRTVCDRRWQLVVVDNASTDDTVDVISNFQFRPPAGGSNFQLIRNKENLGFAEGNNVGIRKAIADGAEYVVLLNQDTVVEPDWLTRIVETAEHDKKIGAVQARLMLWNKKDTVNSIGNAIHFLGFGYSGGYQKKFEFRPLVGGSNFEITYASGAAVLYRRQALADVGLLDESFFMYHEDLDIGWRLWRAGWKSVLAPSSVVYHKYEFSRSIRKYYYMERNRFLVLLENYSLPTLLFIFPAFMAMELGMVFFTIRSGWWKEKLRAYAYFFRFATWNIIVRKRREKHKTFRCPERELLRHFVGTIEFQDVQNSALKHIANPLFQIYWRMIRAVIWW